MFNHHTRAVLLSLAVFVLLAIAQTWPIAQAPSHWSRVDGDGGLNTWTVSWVAHALLTNPAGLFDANIFHPQKLTLAYSEAMLVQSMFAVPVIAAGGSAVLAYNVAVIAGFALTGWAFCLLVRRWTGSWPAGYVAGSLAAFNAFTLVQLTHLQFLHTEFVAVMLFGLDRLIVVKRWRDVATLAAGFALNALTSIYLMVFSVWMLIFAVLARARELWAGKLPAMARLAAGGALAALLLAPYLAEYRAVNKAMGFVRGFDEQEAASWANYASTGSRVHFERWSRGLGAFSTSNTFPGFAAIALIVVAFSDRRNTADPRFQMCTVAAAGCAAVSFAPLLPFYRELHAAIPLFQAIRVLSHIGQIVLLMVAVLAGFGMATLARAWKHAPSWPAVVIAVVVLVNGEALRAPIGYTWFDGVPKIYDVLAADPRAVIVEMPFPLPQQWFLNGLYMVNSTAHWRPMLNGYSGFRPASYYAAYEIMQTFPSPASLIALHELGVTHVVVHQDMLGGVAAGGYDPFASVASMQLMVRDNNILIYRLGGH